MPTLRQGRPEFCSKVQYFYRDADSVQGRISADFPLGSRTRLGGTGPNGKISGIRLFSMALALRSGFKIEGEYFIDRGGQGQWGSATPDDVPFT